MSLDSIWGNREVRKNEVWCDDSVKYLVDNYHKISTIEISKHLGFSERSIYNKAWRLMRDGVIKKITYVWTDEELCFLKENYDKMTSVEIGKVLGRTSGSITAKASRIGLGKRKEKVKKRRKNWWEA